MEAPADPIRPPTGLDSMPGRPIRCQGAGREADSMPGRARSMPIRCHTARTIRCHAATMRFDSMQSRCHVGRLNARMRNSTELMVRSTALRMRLCVRSQTNSTDAASMSNGAIRHIRTSACSTSDSSRYSGEIFYFFLFSFFLFFIFSFRTRKARHQSVTGFSYSPATAASSPTMSMCANASRRRSQTFRSDQWTRCAVALMPMRWM